MPSIWELAIEDITAKRIEQLAADQQAESIWLEFKRDLNLKKDSDKREAGKDVSAFANARGGLLIYGVEEKTLENGRKVAAGTKPVTEGDLMDRLADTLHARIDPRPEFRVRMVPAGESAWYVVVKVEPSHHELHAVDAQFYKRSDTGAQPMSAGEVRARHEQLFQLKANGEERVRAMVREEAIGSPWVGILLAPISFGGTVPIHTMTREHFEAKDLPKPLSTAYQFRATHRGFEAAIPQEGQPDHLVRLRRDGVLHVGTGRFHDDRYFQDTRIARHCLMAARIARHVWGRLDIRGPVIALGVLRTDRELRASEDRDLSESITRRITVFMDEVVVHYPRGLDDGSVLGAEVLNRIAHFCTVQRSRLVDEQGKLLPMEQWASIE